MKKMLFPLIGLWMVVGYGCLKDPDFEQLSSDFVVVTNQDPNTNFASYNTYYISDTVAVVKPSGNDTILKTANSQKLVDAVKQNMAARGYTFVSKGSNPDLGINVGVTKDVSVGVVYSGWWAGYPGWWDPWYWGWYYPYYYPWAYYYTVETGSVIVDMVDLKNVRTNNAIKVVWTTFGAGAVGDNLDANVQRGVDAINQAFAQTPNLKRN